MHWYELVREKTIIALAAFFMLTLPKIVFAQSDTLLLEGVEVTAHRLKRDIAGVTMDELKPVDAISATGQTLDKWLERKTNLYIRSYGPGSSAGVSIRGSSSSQTQILINGIPFENPGLATSDISNLPTGIFSGMSIYRGSVAAYLGNAAIGGSILMETTEAILNPSITQTLTGGSFGSYQSVTKAQYGNTRFTGSTRFYFNHAENDFLRPDPVRKKEFIKQTNARFEAKGLAQDFNFYGKRNGKGHVFLWAGDTQRQIPPIKSKRDSKTSQHDRSLRVQGIYQTEILNTTVQINTAVDHGTLNYKEPAANLDEDSEYTTVHSQLEIRKAVKNFQFFGLGIFKQSHVLTEAYESIETRTSPAIVAGVNAQFFSGATRASLVVREEFLNGKILPTVPVLSVDQKLIGALHFMASGGKSYRLPGLNDMFWNPGGNPDLIPESGWFQEAGLAYDIENEKYKIDLRINAFHRLIKNWIQWIPGPTYWSARNIKEVRSSGFEAIAEVQHRMGSLTFKHSASALYAESVSLKPAFDGDNSVQKQLIYMPLWTAIAQESIGLKDEKLMVNLSGKYNGEVFTTADNSKSLQPYFLLDVEVISKMNFNKHTLVVFAAARNVLDVDYQVQASHYMPGISYEAGIQFQFNFKK